MESRETELWNVVRAICELNRNESYASYVAKLVIAKMNQSPNRNVIDSDLVTMRAYAESIFRADTAWMWLPRDLTPVDRHTIIAFFNAAFEELGRALNYIIWSVRDGLPLYCKVEGGLFVEAGHDHESAQFVRGMGKFDTAPEHYTKPPVWSESLYISQKQLNELDGFFADGPEGEAYKARCAAFQWHLKQRELPEGVKTAAISTVDQNCKAHDTMMLRVVNKVVDRYYGENYDPSDPDTYTPQQTVVAWLMESFGLSRREAEAVDIVTRPDVRRNKR